MSTIWRTTVGRFTGLGTLTVRDSTLTQERTRTTYIEREKVPRVGHQKNAKEEESTFFLSSSAPSLLILLFLDYCYKKGL